MRSVFLYTLMMVAGLMWSQILPWIIPETSYPETVYAIRLLMTWTLAFIMIQVGYEFEVGQENAAEYGKDFSVAALTAAFPWMLVAFYILMVIEMPDGWSWYAIKDSLLKARFSGPSSAGIVLALLASAGLAKGWVYRKIGVLAIDVDTLLLIIPIKILGAGGELQLVFVTSFIAVMLIIIWRYRHQIAMPCRWYHILAYGAGCTVLVEGLYRLSILYDPENPVIIEVLLPAFALGCAIRHPTTHDEHHSHGFEDPRDQRAAKIITGVFMVIVGLSMPPLSIATDSGELMIHESMFTPQMQESPVLGTPDAVLRDMGSRNVWPPPAPDLSPGIGERLQRFLDHPLLAPLNLDNFADWRVFVFHVLAITLLSILGKMLPMFFYRAEATFRERLALALGLQPRGEEGAGVLVISLTYGLQGPAVTIAMLALVVNLLLTPVFILAIKDLLKPKEHLPRTPDTLHKEPALAALPAHPAKITRSETKDLAHVHSTIPKKHKKKRKRGRARGRRKR